MVCRPSSADVKIFRGVRKLRQSPGLSALLACFTMRAASNSVPLGALSNASLRGARQIDWSDDEIRFKGTNTNEL